MVVIKPYEAASSRHRGRDPQLRPRREPDQRRQRHPDLGPAARPRNVAANWSSRPSPRARTPRCRSATSAARRWRSWPASRRTARPARTRSGRAEKDLDKTTAQVHRPDRRAGQAQRRRTAGGLDRPFSKRIPWQTPTGDAAAEEDVAGRARPAGRHRRRVPLGCAHRHPAVRAAVSGSPSSPSRWRSPPTRWCAGCATAATSIPICPLLVGGQAIVWLTWPFGADRRVGRLRRHRAACA